MAAKGNIKHESCSYMDRSKFNINLWEVDRDEEHHDPHHYLVAISDVALPPSKDFYTINVSRDQVITRIWKIVPPHRMSEQFAPKEFKDTYEEFLEDDTLQSEIQRMGGSRLLDYLVNIIKGQLDYLPRLPTNVLHKIMLNTELQDISAMTLVSKQFREVCNSDELWEKVYRTYSETPITADIEGLAMERGWKRLFFTNKLQLQMQLRRMKNNPGGPPPGGYAFLTSDQQDEMTY